MREGCGSGCGWDADFKKALFQGISRTKLSEHAPVSKVFVREIPWERPVFKTFVREIPGKKAFFKSLCAEFLGKRPF